jgi:hypothetical protein
LLSSCNKFLIALCEDLLITAQQFVRRSDVPQGTVAIDVLKQRLDELEGYMQVHVLKLHSIEQPESEKCACEGIARDENAHSPETIQEAKHGKSDKQHPERVQEIPW